MSGRVALGFCAAALAASGLAPVAEAGHLPRIAGETVITVDRAAKMRIEIPRRAQLVVDTRKSVDVDGGGRLAGVILRENHPQGEETSFVRGPKNLGGEVYGMGHMVGSTCKEGAPVVGGMECTPAKFYDLRRGTYTLYAFSEGNVPARITLRFANYSGAIALNPSIPVASASAPMSTSVSAPVAWSGGASVRTDGPASLYTVAWWKSDESAATEAGTCWYEGSAGIEQAGQHRWVPGCPGASSIAGGEIRHPVNGAYGPAKAGQHGVIGMAWPERADTWGLGAWTMAQGVRDTGGFAYWVGR